MSCGLRVLAGSPACLPAVSPADEMTVGKVYAALMIFDFYKQSKTSRDQTHPAPGLSQVPAPTLGAATAGAGRAGKLTRPGCARWLRGAPT